MNREHTPPGGPVEAGPPGEEQSASGLTSRLGRNLRAFGAAQVATRVAGLLVVVILARELGRSDFGRYSVAIAVVSVLTIFLEAGLGGYLVREGSQRPERLPRVLGHILMLRGALGVAAVLVALLFGAVLEYDQTTLIALGLLASSAVMRVIANSYLTVLQAIERVRDVAAVQSLQAFGLAVAGASTALLGGGLVGVAGAMLAVSATFPLLAWRQLRRRWTQRLEVTARELRRTLGAAITFSASGGLQTTLTYLDAIMIYSLLGSVQAGLYGASYRVLFALTFLPAIYVDAATRSISLLASTDRTEMTKMHSRAVAHLSMVAVPLAIGGAILAEPLLGFVFGADFTAAAGAMSILLLAAVFVIPSWIQITSAYALGLERKTAVVFGLAVVGNGLANLAVIPLFGIAGSAAATLGAEAFTFGTIGWLIRREGVPLRLAAIVAKPLGAGALMALAVWPLRDAPLALPVAVGAVAYLAALLALRPFEAEDRVLLRALLRPRSADAGPSESS